MSLRSPLGKVRGLGSAKEGVAHWWAQRMTAVALVPLLIWFVVLEDYVHTEWLKIASIAIVKFAAIGLAVATIFSIVKIALG